MYREGHWGIGMLSYAPVVFALLLAVPSILPHLLLGVAVMAFSCTFPDIDMRLKNFTPIKHRGITHTVWFALFVGGIVAVTSYGAGLYVVRALPEMVSMADVQFFMMFGAVLGVYGTLTHFIGDIITPTGLRPLEPVSSRRFRRVLTVAGQESKAANGYWNHAFHVFGDVSIVLAFVFGFPRSRKVFFDFIQYVTQFL